MKKINIKVEKVIRAIKFLDEKGLRLSQLNNNELNEREEVLLKNICNLNKYKLNKTLAEEFKLVLSGSRLNEELINSRSDYDYFTEDKESFNKAISFLRSIALYEVEEYVGYYLYLGTEKINKFGILVGAKIIEVHISLVEEVIEQDIAEGISFLKKFLESKVTLHKEDYLRVLKEINNSKNLSVYKLPPMAVRREIVTKKKNSRFYYDYEEYEFIYPRRHKMVELKR